MPAKALLYAVTAVGCGIAALVLYAIEGSRMAIQQKGASVQGSVTKSWMTKGGRRNRTEKHWVDYTYTVNGASFKGEERRVTGPLGQGGPIQVWYDPQSPDRCVSDAELRYGRDLQWPFILGGVGFFSLIATAILFFKRSPPPPATA